MNNNRVLVKVIVPEIDMTFDLFIPTNEILWKVKKLIIKSIGDLTGGLLDMKLDYALIDKSTGITYSNNAVVVNTNIRNASELILLLIKNDANGTSMQDLFV